MLEDKKKAVIAALKHPKGAKKSDNQIAQHVGVSQPMVSKYREQLAATSKDYKSPEREGADGKTYDTTNIGSTPEPEEEEADVQLLGCLGGGVYLAIYR